MHRQRGEHVLNGDRGEVDYTVGAGDLMTDTHNAPSADDRHHEERTDEDAKSQLAGSECCITKRYSRGRKKNHSISILVIAHFVVFSDAELFPYLYCVRA